MNERSKMENKNNDIGRLCRYTEDHIYMYPSILRDACIYGRLPLIQKLLQDPNILSDVREDYIQTYITYSFWKDFCKEVPVYNDIVEVQNTRIYIANILLDMYPDTMLHSATMMKYTIDKYYEIAYENGLYLLAEYIFIFCNIHRIKIKMDSFDKTFICACENNIMNLVQLYCKKNPYRYSIIQCSSKDIDSEDCIIAIPEKSGSPKYGIIRSFRNEQWEKKRLILYKLHYENVPGIKNLPIDVIRYMFSYME